MSFFTDANADAMSVAVDDAATGPRVGFLESFNVAVEAQMRASAQYGIEYHMNELDWKQTNAMRDAGVEAPPRLLEELRGDQGFIQRTLGEGLRTSAGEIRPLLDVASLYSGKDVEDGVRERVARYDARIAEMQAQFPELGLRTSEDMFGEVREKAQYYDRRLEGDRRTTGGSIGSFFGGALASMHPGTDPFNFYTMGVGGVGKTAAARIGAQAGGQGLVEGINQITGVQTEREMLGLSHGLGDAMSRVAGAAIGGGVLQGTGEGVAFAFRKWFRSGPGDPAPLPEAPSRPELPDTSSVPPRAIPADEGLAGAKLTREPLTYDDHLAAQAPFAELPGAGRLRAVEDLDYFTLQMNDWEGDLPINVRPRTETATNTASGQRVYPNFREVADKSVVHDVARQVDPDTFRRFDSHLVRKNTYRKWLDEMGPERDADIDAKLQDVSARIAELEASRPDVRGKSAKAAIRREIRGLKDQGRQIVLNSAKIETPDIARVRSALMREDEKMRDLAPLVSRAYSRARQQWSDTKADRDVAHRMIEEARYDVPGEGSRTGDPEVNRAELGDKAPLLQGAPRVADKVKRDADAADVASAIVAENAKVLDEAVGAYRASIDSLLGTEKNGEITVDGQDFKLNMDSEKLLVPLDDGTGSKEVSVRQLLEDNKLSEQEIEAVTTCSLR